MVLDSSPAALALRFLHVQLDQQAKERMAPPVQRPMGKCVRRADGGVDGLRVRQAQVRHEHPREGG